LTDLFATILAQVAGTYEAGLIALEKGFCFFLGGGMHHARRDGGAGFCPLNDSMIAVAKLRAEKRVRTAWIIDVDAHKGDGTAEIALDDPDTLTLSIHMASGWPLDPASLDDARRDSRSDPYRFAPLAPSDVEIPVARGEDALYLDKLAAGLAKLEALSAGRLPDIAIVVDGADPYVHDGLESSADLALSLDQCVERDELVLGFLRARKIPSAWIMSGGYGERAWEPPAAFLSKIKTMMAGQLQV
jgi:acetoin utilization deacetylase AcuC-like enzyme